MVTEKRPSKNSSSAKMANSDSAAVGVVCRGTGGGFAAPVPEQPRAAGFEQQQQNREARHKKFLELHARALRRKTAAVLGFKQRRAALAGEFVQFQFFQPLVFFEPHLEPADERHQHAEAEENRRRLSRQRTGENRHAKTGEKNQRRDREVHQPVFLNVAFH